MADLPGPPDRTGHAAVSGLEWVDGLPREVRALVHEFGERAVRACWEFRITDPAHIRDLIVSVRSDREIRQNAHQLDSAGLHRIMRQRCIAAGSQKQLAADLGISTGYLCDVLNARREPSDRMLAGLGLRPVTRFERVRP